MVSKSIDNGSIHTDILVKTRSALCSDQEQSDRTMKTLKE